MHDGQLPAYDRPRLARSAGVLQVVIGQCVNGKEKSARYEWLDGKTYTTTHTETD